MSKRIAGKVVLGALAAYMLASCGGGGGGPAGLLFALASLANPVVGQAYSATLTVNGGTGPYTFTITGTLPAGVAACDTTPRANCPITGTPTTWSATAVQLTVQVTDSSTPPLTGTKTYSLKVDPVGGVLQVQPAVLPGGVLNTPYTGQIAASGGQATYTWTLASGSLPTGVPFCAGATGPTCLLNGTPTANGTYTFTVQVTDSNSPAQSVQKQYTVQVAPTAAPGSLTVSVNGNGSVTSSPAGLNCPPTCSASYSGGAQVTLTLTSADFWEFQSWTGCDQETGATCVMTMSGNRNVAVNFRQMTAPTTTLPGTLTLPAGLSPANFEVGNQFASATPDAAGHFNMPVLSSGVTVTIAAPKNQPDSDILWVAVTLMIPGQPQPTQVAIDTTSTAQGILMLFPLFMTPDPNKEKIILDTMGNVPEVQTLAAQVAQKFPTELHPLQDTDFQNAYVAAANAVAAALPDQFTLASAQPPVPEPTPKPSEVLQKSGPTIQIHWLDHQPQVDLEAAPNNEIEVSGKVWSLLEGNPLDTYVTMWQVDPSAVQSLMAGGTAVGNFQMKSVDDALGRDNEPDSTNPRFPRFKGEEVAPVSTSLAPAKSVFKYLDIFDDIQDQVKDALDLSKDHEKLELPSTNDAVYIIRGFNGKLSSGADRGEADFGWQNYRSQSIRATALNVFDGGLDLISVVFDQQEVVETCGGKVFTAVLLKSEQSLGGAVLTEDPQGAYRPLLDIGLTTSTELLKCAFEAGTKYGALKGLKWSEKVAAFMTVVSIISKLGALSERITALSGSKTAFTAAPLRTTPMDSIIVVVGDPFGPVVQTINGVDPANPPSPLPCIHIGDPLTIVGIGFKKQPTDPDPRLLITDEIHSQVEVKGFTLTAGTGTPTPYTIQTTLPDHLGGRLRFSLIQYGQTDTPEGGVLQVCPTILGITPRNYFRTVPNPVIIQGKGFLPSSTANLTRDRWVLGGSSYLDDSDSFDTLVFGNLPASIPIGNQEVKVQFDSGLPPAAGTPPVYFRVLGPPTVTSIAPANGVYSGQVLTVNGTNFGDRTDDASVRLETDYPAPGMALKVTPFQITSVQNTADDQTATLFVVMGLSYSDPTPGTPDLEPMPARLLITTPEGTSASFNFTVLPTPALGTQYNRTLYLPDLAITDAINYANQDPAPPGTVLDNATCDVSGICGTDSGGNPIQVTNNGECKLVFPPEYHYNPVTGSVGVTSGIQGTGPVSCNACYSSFSCGGISSQPSSWVGIAPENISDHIEIDGAYYPGGGIINLSSLAPGVALRGPKVTVDLYSSLSTWHVQGGGLVIDQTGDKRFGRDGLPQQIVVTLVDDAATGTAITVQNAQDVHLHVRIYGALSSPACSIGVLIQNSKHITVDGEIGNCEKGTVVQNSDDVTLGFHQLYGYQSAGITLDGVTNSTVDTTAGYQLVNEDPGTIIVPAGQQTGILITGASNGNFIGNTGTGLLGNQNAIWLQSGTNNYISPMVGTYSLPGGGIAMTDSQGGSVRNQVGIRVSDGAVSNVISSGATVGNCPVPRLFAPGAWVVMADIGILIEGGSQNTICGVYLGIMESYYDSSLAVPNRGNRVGLELRGSLTSQPNNDSIRGNIFSDNTQYGVEADGATQTNTFLYNYFGSAHNTGPLPDPANHVCGIHVTNLSKAVVFTRNRFVGEVAAVCLDNSDAVQFNSNDIKNSQTDGVKMSSSQNVSFNGDQVYSDNKTGQRGMHFIASSAFHLNDIQVFGINGSGLEIEQAPAASAGVGTVSADWLPTFAAPPQRTDFLGPIYPPLWSYIVFASGPGTTAIHDNTGRGIFIHDGARDVTLSIADVYGNGGNGVELNNTGDNIHIENSALGNMGQSQRLPNGGDGVHVESNTGQNVFIGSPKKGNWIPQNMGWGIQIVNSEHVSVQDNAVGSMTSVPGVPLLQNTLGGIRVANSDDVLIGGNDPNSGNLVSANTGDGIQVQDFRNYPSPPIQIEGNFIGTGLDGQTGQAGSLGNTGYGIHLEGTPPTPDAAITVTDNLVAGNARGGVFSEQWGAQNGPTIESNIIGQWALDAARTSPPNSGPAIFFNNSNRGMIRNNRIGPNQGEGVDLMGSSGNLISLNTVQNGTGDGVVLESGSSSNTVGLNKITTNSGNGVVVAGSSVQNAITRNSITANTANGIALATGGNLEIPFPTIRYTGKTADGTYAFFGDVPIGVPDGSNVELFMDEGGQGRVYLASIGSVNHVFQFYGVEVPAGETFAGKGFHTTVTDPNNNTSEFGPVDINLAGFARRVASNRSADIALTNAVDKSTSLVVSTPATDQNPAVCQDSGGNKYVAFSTNRDGNFEIYLTTASGSPVTRLTNNPADDIEPNFNADCSKIAFSTNRDGNYEIYVMNRDGSGQTRLTNNPGQDRQPDFSSDGTKMVFSSDRGGNFELYTMNADGTNVQKLTTLGGVNRNPAWKGGPNLIAFEACTGAAPSYEPCGVALYNVSTGASQTITPPARSDHHPSWFAAASGAYYLVVSSDAVGSSGPDHVYLMTTSGFLMFEITPSADDDREPSCCLGP